LLGEERFSRPARPRQANGPPTSGDDVVNYASGATRVWVETFYGSLAAVKLGDVKNRRRCQCRWAVRPNSARSENNSFSSWPIARTRRTSD